MSAEHTAWVHKKLETAKRILTRQRHDKGKMSSMHASEIECIAKGIAHKSCKFGLKTGDVSTDKVSFEAKIGGVLKDHKILKLGRIRRNL